MFERRGMERRGVTHWFGARSVGYVGYGTFSVWNEDAYESWETCEC